MGGSGRQGAGWGGPGEQGAGRGGESDPRVVSQDGDGRGITKRRSIGAGGGSGAWNV